MLSKSVLAISFFALRVLANTPTAASAFDFDALALQKREESCGNDDIVYNNKNHQCQCVKPGKCDTKKQTLCPPPIHETRGIPVCGNGWGCGIYCFSNFIENEKGTDCVCPADMVNHQNKKCICKPGYVITENGESCKKCKHGKVPNKKGTKCVHPPSGYAKRSFDPRDDEMIFFQDSQTDSDECGFEGRNCNDIEGAESTACVSGQCVVLRCSPGLTKTKSNGMDACE